MKVFGQNLTIGRFLRQFETFKIHYFDFAFIDADKSQYEDYYELCLKLLRVGGLIIVDNVFQQGKVVTNSNANESVRAICTFNMKLLKDDRVDISLIPMSDGITLARKN